MKLFLIINLFLFSSTSSFTVTNTCRKPSNGRETGCLLVVQFSNCELQSASAENLKVQERIEEIDKRGGFQCYGVIPQKVRCFVSYNNLDRESDNRYKINEDVVIRILKSHSDIETKIKNRLVQVSWIKAAYENNKPVTKEEEIKHWKDCVLKNIELPPRSTSSPFPPISSQPPPTQPASIKLNCTNSNSNDFCRYDVKYNSLRITSIISTPYSISDPKISYYYSKQLFSCRAYHNFFTCFCSTNYSQCFLIEEVFEAIYILSRDNYTRSSSELKNQGNSEEIGNFGPLLDLLENYRSQEIESDLKSQQVIHISEDCDITGSNRPVSLTPTRNTQYFSDPKKPGSISIEMDLTNSSGLSLNIFCNIQCREKQNFPSVSDLLRKQLYWKNHKFIDFIGPNNEPDGYILCAYNALKSQGLNLNVEESLIDLNSTYFKNDRGDLTVDLILCSTQSIVFVFFIFIFMIIGIISNSRHRKKVPELKKKQPVVVNREVNKTTENTKSKHTTTTDSRSVDFYENVTKTETVNNTDLASNFDETKSIEKKK
ncbi:unnamed protein product [Caenorhabditis angaria]|uniref:CX domain-containing protein n=1 Tax=Caenorhabditis angaria TaxID=860376 RepID=A0A9P1MWS9_9PELO|nr:unnamed protein product [Caenorhabditis angaria]